MYIYAFYKLMVRSWLDEMSAQDGYATTKQDSTLHLCQFSARAFPLISYDPEVNLAILDCNLDLVNVKVIMRVPET